MDACHGVPGGGYLTEEILFAPADEASWMRWKRSVGGFGSPWAMASLLGVVDDLLYDFGCALFGLGPAKFGTR